MFRLPSDPILYLPLIFQIAWVCIGVASWRFRQAWKAQGRDPSELKFRNRTWPFGPPIVIVFVSFMILIQGWDCFKGVFDAVSFVSYYIELPVFFVGLSPPMC